MAWPWEVVERDHEIQNPTSAAKIRRLGEYLRLGPGSAVLDLACGKGGPALLLAATFGCRVVGVEVRPAFAAEARRRAAERGLDGLVEIHVGDAREHRAEPESVDAALCLGAAFVWGHLGDAAEALRPAVRPGGFVAVGEPFWRRRDLPDGVDPEYFVDLPATVARFEAAGLALTGVIPSSTEDWDHYESQHWRAVAEWLEEEPGHPDAAEVRRRDSARRAEYLTGQRDLLEWAVFVGRRPVLAG